MALVAQTRDNARLTRKILRDPGVDYETKAKVKRTFYRRKKSKFHKSTERRGIDSDPALDWAEMRRLFEQDCLYCGIDWSSGVDRFCNTGGYYLSNLRPCCGTCNKAKGRMHGDHFVAHAHKYVDYQDRFGRVLEHRRSQRILNRRLTLADFNAEPLRCSWTSMMRDRRTQYGKYCVLSEEKRQRKAFEAWAKKIQGRKPRIIGGRTVYFHTTLMLSDWLRLVGSQCTFCGEQPAHGIDRIHDEDLIYSPENTQSCCAVCNYLKGSLSNAEFNELLRTTAERHPYDPAKHEEFRGITGVGPQAFYFVDAKQRSYRAIQKSSEIFQREKSKAEGREESP